MATMTPSESKKHVARRYHFMLAGKRKSIRFPAMNHSDAISIKQRIENLVTCKRLGNDPKPTTVKWLIELDEDIYNRISETGLVDPRQVSLLGEFLTDYIASRKQASPNTLRNYNQTAERLRTFFGPDKPLREITKGDAKEWRQNLCVLRGPN